MVFHLFLQLLAPRIVIEPVPDAAFQAFEAETHGNLLSILTYALGIAHDAGNGADDLLVAPGLGDEFLTAVGREFVKPRSPVIGGLSPFAFNPAVQFQSRAIRRIGEAFEKDHDRRALLVMATGAGKTRTVIALCDLRMRIEPLA
jgi:Type III restriction enzyme, res subunit